MDSSTSSTLSGHDAYRQGLCKQCRVRPYQPGCTMCETCFPEPAERLRRARELAYVQHANVLLTQQDWDEAKRYGKARHEEAKSAGYRDNHGHSGSDGQGLRDHVIGVAGEIAVFRKVFGQDDWVPLVNVYQTKPNGWYNGKPVRVRTRGQHNWDLLVRHDNPDDYWVILVTWNRNTPQDLNFRVHGYMQVREAKQPQWLQAYGGRNPEWFVPQGFLRPLREFLKDEYQ